MDNSFIRRLEIVHFVRDIVLFVGLIFLFIRLIALLVWVIALFVLLIGHLQYANYSKYKWEQINLR